MALICEALGKDAGKGLSIESHWGMSFAGLFRYSQPEQCLSVKVFYKGTPQQYLLFIMEGGMDYTDLYSWF